MVVDDGGDYRKIYSNVLLDPYPSQALKFKYKYWSYIITYYYNILLLLKTCGYL